MDETQPQFNTPAVPLNSTVFSGPLTPPDRDVLVELMMNRYKSAGGAIPGMLSGQQLPIAHGLGITPTMVAINGYTSDHPIFEYQAPDATNIYVQNGASIAFGGGRWYANYIKN